VVHPQGLGLGMAANAAPYLEANSYLGDTPGTWKLR